MLPSGMFPVSSSYPRRFVRPEHQLTNQKFNAGRCSRPIICNCFETGDELPAAPADDEDSNRGTTVTFMSVSKTPEKYVTTTEKSDLSLVGKTNLALAVKVNLCGQSRSSKHQTEGVSK